MNRTLDLLTWYVMRATGAVALILITASVVLGILATVRLQLQGMPVSVSRAIHRNISLLSVAFLAVHVVTSVLQAHAHVSLLDVLVPLLGSTHRFALALGTMSVDLLIAVTLTTVFRRHLGRRTWRAVHWLSYLSWPSAFVHGIAMGSDVSSPWMLAINAACLVALAGAVAARVEWARTHFVERRTSRQEVHSWH